MYRRYNKYFNKSRDHRNYGLLKSEVEVRRADADPEPETEAVATPELPRTGRVLRVTNKYDKTEVQLQAERIAEQAMLDMERKVEEHKDRLLPYTVEVRPERYQLPGKPGRWSPPGKPVLMRTGVKPSQEPPAVPEPPDKRPSIRKVPNGG